MNTSSPDWPITKTEGRMLVAIGGFLQQPGLLERLRHSTAARKWSLSTYTSVVMAWDSSWYNSYLSEWLTILFCAVGLNAAFVGGRLRQQALALAVPALLPIIFPIVLGLFERDAARIAAGQWWRLLTAFLGRITASPTASTIG